MKKFIFSFLMGITLALSAFSNGIIIVNTQEEIYLTLTASSVETQVNNQVAITRTLQTFYNGTGQEILAAKYAFPLPDGASAIGLRWLVNGVWYEASIAAEPQDTTITGGGSGASQALMNYLGASPLFFSFDALQIGVDSLIQVELTYVELLPYSFNLVSYYYPNDYSLIQPGPGAIEQHFSWTMESDRTILSVQFPSPEGGTVNVSDHFAEVSFSYADGPANANYLVVYELSSDELGVWSMSTYLPDSLVICDDFGKGFVAFVIEPESNPDVEVIEKNFILVVDRSGSMGGNKIVQARQAASFIVQHLNPGDHFNVIDFDDQITLFAPNLVPYNVTTQNNALGFISALTADGSTNIAAALTTAIGQFGAIDPGKANIILFFTDGQPTAGITSTQGILDAVDAAVTQAETTIFLYAFGIGNDVNKQLLAALGANNNGLATFLENDELEASITDFFLKVNNPVLLSPHIQFFPDVIQEVYPQPLPNLYKGQQLIIAGRYEEPIPVDMELTGMAFNLPITYNFNINLADTLVSDYFFLPKVWAKRKIEHLQQAVYLAGENTPLGDTLEAQATALSICYGVISDFTSFTGPPVTFVHEQVRDDSQSWTWEALPNPFQEAVTLRIFLPVDWYEPATCLILDAQGRIVAEIPLSFGPAGWYDFSWNGRLANGLPAPKGIYFAVLNVGNDWDVLTLMKN